MGRCRMNSRLTHYDRSAIRDRKGTWTYFHMEFVCCGRSNTMQTCLHLKDKTHVVNYSNTFNLKQLLMDP